MKKIDGFVSEKLIALPPHLLHHILSHPLNRMLYLTDIGYFPRALYHHRERKEGCDAYILIYCTGGAGWVSIDGTLHEMQAGRLIVIPAFKPHVYGADSSNPWTIYWFHFKGEQAGFYSGLLKEGQCALVLAEPDSRTFITLFHQCYDLLLTSAYSASHQILAMQTAAYAMSLLGLISEREAEARNKRYIEAALHFMTMHLDGTLTLDEIAWHVQLSRQHLNHLFKSATGFAPIDYYNRLKIQRAGQLLELTSLSVKEICHAVGFKDPYYFSRLFKKITGLSPTAYRGEPR